MSDTSRLPFAADKQLRGFEAALTEFITETIAAKMAEIVPPENAQVLKHGKVWSRDRDDLRPAVGGFLRHEAGAEVKAADIASNDLSVLVRFPAQLTESMHGAAMTSLYATVGEAAEEVGNVISAGGRPFTPELFLELLQKVEFGVDRQGRVSMPQLHVHPETAKRIIPLLERQGPEFRAKVDEIKAEKGREALAREEARLARYKGYRPNS